MFRSFFYKLLYSLLVLWGVVSLVFLLFNATGGAAAEELLGQRADEASRRAVQQQLGLDKPPLLRYLHYLHHLSPLGLLPAESNKGITLLPLGSVRLCAKTPELGRSFLSNRQVGSIIAESLTGTLVLATAAMLLATLLGISLGMVAALKKGTWQDRLVMLLSTTGISIPSFFAAVLIAWLFGYVLHPVTGLNMTGSLMDYTLQGGASLQLQNLILPAVTLGIRPLAVIAQLTRTSLIEALAQDYVRTARAKGLSERRVVFRHALRNALNPVLTAVSGWFASLMAGAFFVEYVFNWKGIGKITVEALEKNDLPVVMGAVLTVALFFVVINLLVDMAYRWLDPRVS